jgi:hypothetical protein
MSKAYCLSYFNAHERPQLVQHAFQLDRSLLGGLRAHRQLICDLCGDAESGGKFLVGIILVLRSLLDVGCALKQILYRNLTCAASR